MHFHQILIDRVKFGVFRRLDQLIVIGRIFDGELLLRIFILFHVESIFDALVSVDTLASRLSIEHPNVPQGLLGEEH